MCKAPKKLNTVVAVLLSGRAGKHVPVARKIESILNFFIVLLVISSEE